MCYGRRSLQVVIKRNVFYIYFITTNRPSSAVSIHITIDSQWFLQRTDIHLVHTTRFLIVFVFQLVTVFCFHASCTKRNMANKYNHVQLLPALLTINKRVNLKNDPHTLCTHRCLCSTNLRCLGWFRSPLTLS